MKRPMERNATAILRKAACGDDRKPRHLPCKQSFQGSARGRVGSLLTGAAILLLSAAGAHAQFGPQPVGTSTGNQGVTVTASVAGTVSSVQILTHGLAVRRFCRRHGSLQLRIGHPGPRRNMHRIGALHAVHAWHADGCGGVGGHSHGRLGQVRAGHRVSLRHRNGRAGGAGCGQPAAGGRAARPLHGGWRRPAGHSGSTLLA